MWPKYGKSNSKYHNKKTEVDGITFDSKKEANRYIELRKLEKAKEIYSLQLQVPFVLIDKSKYGKEIKYVADFVYYDVGLDEKIVEDIKGFRTDLYKLKKRLMAERYGIVIKEV